MTPRQHSAARHAQAVLVGTFVPGSPEWHAARQHGLGGSEIGTVLGLSPFDSRFALWHRKAGNIAEVDESPEMEWGKRLEPVILGKYREEHPDVDFDVVNGTFRHADRPWQIANPDLLAADRVIDAKFSMFGDGWGEPGTAEVPPHIRCQGIWYADVLGVDRIDLAVLVGGCDYREYTLEYDADEAEELREAAVEFLDSITLGHRPDIDAHSATYQAIKELHPDIDPTEVELSYATARAYITAKHAEKAAKDRAQLATSVLADEMGTAARAMWDGECIARRQARGDGIPYVVAARNLPVLDETEVAA
jgi:putative phage-type endonuclease